MADSCDASPKPERVWRLRKLHHQIDAELIDLGGGVVEVCFLYDGESLYRRGGIDRACALTGAASRRTELERSGWTAHW